MSSKEIRALSPVTELRAVKQDGVMRLSGLAIPYGVRSADLGGFVEIAAAGLVKRSLRDQPRVLALRDHDPSKLLGSTSANTLTLRDSPDGLAFDLTVPDTEVGRDTYENVRLGNLQGVSWGFTTRKDSWANVDGKTVRTLHDIDLMEISPTAFPAYGKATSVSVRTCPPEFRSLISDIFGDLNILGDDDDSGDDDGDCPCGDRDEDGKCSCPDSDEDTTKDAEDGQRHMRLQLSLRRLR